MERITTMSVVRAGHRRLFLLGSPIVAAATILMAVASAHGHPGTPTLPTAPTVTAAPTATRAPAPPEIAVAIIFDRYPGLARQADDAKHALADAIDALVVPGRGSMVVHVLGIGQDSYNPRNNEFFSFRTDPVPPQPTRRATIPRPQLPDFSACEKVKSTRARCIDGLQAQYNVALKRALDDEAQAQADYQSAVDRLAISLAKEKAAVRNWTDQLRNLVIPPDNSGWDVEGSLLRAAGLLATSGARIRLLVPVTDWVSGGPVTDLRTLDLRGVVVRSVWYVCHQSAATCLSREDSYRSLLTRAGATSVEFLDPAASSVLPTVFTGVLP
jgi:hypothetical protein